jgi:prepilin-type N-terminal cleavage/methylation domain-containing protein
MLQKMQKRQRGFTLVELMVVVSVIALLASIAVSNFLRGRKRAQATLILENLRIIDSAIDQYAIESNKPSGTIVQWVEIQKYMKTNSPIYNSGGNDLLGNAIGGFSVDTYPKLSSVTFGKLSDIAPSDFWSPFYP